MSQQALVLGSDECRALFPLTNRNLNNGSFGMPSLSVLEKRHQRTLAIDKDPETFLRYDAPSQIRAVNAAIAKHFLGHGGESKVAASLALVDNVGDAFNVCARSLLCNPRLQRALQWTTRSGTPRLPKVVVFDRQYPMVLQCLRYHNARSLDCLGLYLANEQEAGLVDAAEVIKATPPGVVSGCVEWVVVQLTDALLQDEALFISTVVDAVMEADALVMDHVCWSPSVLLPAREVCEAIRAREKAEGTNRRRLLCLDGAHSIGNVDLVPMFTTAGANNDELPFDCFFSNLHKWAMVPRHCAFLYINPLYHAFVHPNIVSNFYMGDEHGPTLSSVPNAAKEAIPNHGESSAAWAALVHCNGHITDRMTREFFWCGTRDYSTYLSVLDAIQFRTVTLGGEAVVQAFVRQIALEGARRVAQTWGTKLVVEDPRRLTAMVSVYCPAEITSEPALHKLLKEMLAQDGTFAAWGVLEGKCFVRLSGQVYLTLDDFSFFAVKFLERLRGASQQQ